MLRGVRVFYASHARWRCEFLLFQPLCGETACFARGIKTGTPVLRGVRFFRASHVLLRCSFRFHYARFVDVSAKSILVLNGVRFFRASRFVQPLHGQDARFAHGLLLLMLGGVAIFKA